MSESGDLIKQIAGQKRKKRVITEARKEQNRVAQQLYRRRQRERTKERGSRRHEVSTNDRQLKPRHAAEILPIEVVSVEDDLSGQDHRRDCTHDENCKESPLNNLTPKPRDVPPLSDELHCPSILPTSLTEDLSDVFNGFSGSDTQSSSDHRIGVADERSVSRWLSLLSDQMPTLPSPGTVWGAPLPLAPFGFSNLDTRENTSNAVARISPSPLDVARASRNASQHAPSRNSPDLSDIVTQTLVFLYGPRSPLIARQNRMPSLPSLYNTTIECSLTAKLRAYAENARCIGLSFTDLLAQKSTFYRRDVTAAQDPQALLAAARKDWIPDHLQPTLAQVLVPHHPYLDLVPFPGLRTRVITLGAAANGLFDPMEFKKDIFLDGLYCRKGERPWDCASWEVATWFVRKWRLLVG